MIQLNRHAYDIPQLSLVVDIEICFGRCRVRGFKIVRRLFVGFCKDCLTQELKEVSVEENLEVRLGYIGTGLHNKLEVPEAKTLLEVNGQINGKAARILLDTGCSTYVLSTQFATRHNIEKTPMKLRSVDLAVSGVGAQFTYETGLTKIRIGN